MGGSHAFQWDRRGISRPPPIHYRKFTTSGGGGDHKNTKEFQGGEENFTAAQIKLQQFTAMCRNDIEETEEDDFILTLGSISSGDRHLLTVLLTTSSNMK